MDTRATVRGLLVRGLVCGVVAALLAWGFAKLFGEPMVDKAIAYEDAHAAPAAAAEAPLVSRGMQASLGLLTGLLMYGLAVGGLFALGFAAALGRLGRLSPRAVAAVLAVVCLVVVVVVPFTKYPSNPPAVGNDDTIGYRSEIYTILVAISVAAAVAAWRLGRDWVGRLGAWNGVLAGVGVYVALMVVAQLAMPRLDEVPRDFPASVIWHFRVATLGIHAVVWSVMGLGFGAVAERFLAGAGRPSRAGARGVTASGA